MTTLKIGTYQSSFSFTHSAQDADRGFDLKDAHRVHTETSDNRTILRKEQADSFHINPAAKSISAADETIKAVNEHIERMKAQLEAIVKNYPPFPPGSSERTEYLKSFIGLRMEIERLTIPPDMAYIKKINMPELSVTATDKDIAAAIDGLDSASEELNFRRSALNADIAVTPTYDGYNMKG